MHNFDSESEPHDPFAVWEVELQAGGDLPPAGCDDFVDPAILPDAERVPLSPADAPEALPAEVAMANQAGQPAEAPERSPEQVASQCSADIRAGLQEAYDKLVYRPWSTPDTYVTGGPIGRLSVSEVYAAAAAGDAAEVDRHIDALTKMSGVDQADIIQACYAGIDAGSETASHILWATLTESNEQQAVTVAYRKMDQPNDVRPHVRQEALETVVDVCLADDKPPHAWIDTYALDNEHHWIVSADYHRKAAAHGGEASEMHRTALNAKIKELADPDKYNERFVFGYVKDALAMTDDRETREAVLERFEQAVAAGVIPITRKNFGILIETGRQVLCDSETADPSWAGYFERLVDSVTAHIVSEDIIPAREAVQSRLPFDIALKQYQGGTAADVVEVIDARFSEAVKMPDSPETAGIPGERDPLLRNRDLELVDQASRAAAAGRLADARVYMGAISAEGTRQRTLSKCLRHTVTPEDVAALRPDELTLLYDEELAGQLAWAELRVSGDTAAIISRVNELASGIQDRGDPAEDMVMSGYETVARTDPAAARQMARDVLHTLRANRRMVRPVFDLSRKLIAAGDSHEPHRAYEYIQQAVPHPPTKLHYLFALSKDIADARRSA